jgi:hypothetical protein
MKINPFTRDELIHRLAHQLDLRSYPRLQMFLLVALTGMFAFLLSLLLLHAGITLIVIRYPIVLGCAYLFFLFLLWLWLRSKSDDATNLPDVFPNWGSGSTGQATTSLPSSPPISGGGGDFAGGGATGSFDNVDASTFANQPMDTANGIGSVSSSAKSSSSGGDVSGFDEILIPFLLLAFVGGMLYACLELITGAPILFAELLMDGSIAYLLLKRTGRLPARSWVGTVWNRTRKVFWILLVFLFIFGLICTLNFPAAQSLADLWRLWRMH